MSNCEFYDEAPRVICTAPRIELTEWSSSFAQDYSALIGDPRVMKYIGNGQPRDLAKAEAEIRNFISHEAEHGYSRWAVRERSTSRFVGMVGFMRRNGEIDFGGRVLREFWGSGYAAEGLVYALKVGLLQRGIRRAFATTVEENERAWKLNKRFGFKHETIFEIDGVRHVKQYIDYQSYTQGGILEQGTALLASLIMRQNRHTARVSYA